ncbi:hypothetical protein PanWU01x14_283870 [Parasponia andersonii]|uniref:Uncharacterized protein n=1 Tax=Parasponia andersonii TaxID=3476 RepID=A0A2P5B090_PARAD|nr:hypothetical protein PanWU01x14_283870 [Parasponia andersonii]
MDIEIVEIAESNIAKITSREKTTFIRTDKVLVSVKVKVLSRLPPIYRARSREFGVWEMILTVSL